MKKLFYGLMLAGMLIMVIASPVLAAVYYASVQVQESDGDSYTRLPIMVSLDNEYLADNNYILATGLDTRVITGSSVELPHLVVDDRLLFVSNINANNTYNFKYTTGNTPLTDMPVIVGYDGYITVSDDADLEPGDDFEIEFDGYVDTSAGSDKNLVYKEDAFVCFVSDTEEISAGFIDGYYPDANVETSSVDGFAYYLDANGQSWATAVADAGDAASDDDADEGVNGQPIGWGCDSVVNEYDILSRGFFVFDTSEIPDDAVIISSTLYIYGSVATNEGSWDDTAINIYSSAPATDTSIVAGDYDSLGVTAFCDTGIDIDDWSTTGYNAFVFNASGLAAISTDDVTKLGGRASYDVSGVDPGWTATGEELTFGCYFADNAGTDKDPKLVVTYGVQVSGVSSGEHTVKAYADGTDLGIIVDEGEAGEVSDTILLSGASVPDNANDIIINQNNVMPYFDYLKWTVSDTLIAWYQPVTMILGTALPDREGADENGVITWGTNPAGVDVGIGSLMAYSQPAPSGTIDEPGQDIVEESGQPGWVEPTGTLTTNPFYPLVKMASDHTGFDVTQIWLMLATFFVLAGMLAVFGFVPHQLITVAVGGGITGLFISMGIYPFWVIFVFLLGGIAVVLWERAPSV